MAVTASAPAPYAPSSVVIDLIRRHRDRGLPGPINAETLQRASVSDSLIPRTLQALATLDLVDENGSPTALFESIRLAPEAEYKKRLEEWLRTAYADAFAFVDPSKDDATRIHDAFRSYQPTGQRDRMVTLFQGLCAEAGLIAEKEKAAKSSSPRVRAKPSAVIRFSTPQPLKADPATTTSTLSNSLPSPLSGLLATLPPASQGWTEKQRDMFIDTFRAVLNYSIPIIPESVKEDVV